MWIVLKSLREKSNYSLLIVWWLLWMLKSATAEDKSLLSLSIFLTFSNSTNCWLYSILMTLFWRSPILNNLIQSYQFVRRPSEASNHTPVASLTTAMSVGLPRPERRRTADTILRYRLSSSSRVLARLSVISRITGCKRDSSTRWCSSRKSP